MDLTISVEKSTKRERTSNNLWQYAEQNWKDGYFNDVTIKVESEEIDASRMVLASCSLYFDRIFKTEMKEKALPVIELEGISEKAVKALIEFSYTGVIEISNRNVLDILTTADYLQMNEPKRFCFEFLQSVITFDSCFALLTVATFHQHNQLKEDVLHFIKENFGDVKFSLNVTKTELITSVSKMKDSKANESFIFNAIMFWIKFSESARKKELLDLLFLLDFNNLTLDFIEDVVLKEDLVTNNLASLQFVTGMFSRVSKAKRLDKGGGSKVLSFGGTKKPCQVVEVYNCFLEPPVLHPNISVFANYICKFACKGLNKNVYTCFAKSGSNVAEIWKKNFGTGCEETNWIKFGACNSANFKLSMDFEELPNTWVAIENDNWIRLYQPQTDTWIDGLYKKQLKRDGQFVSCKGSLYALGGWDGYGRCNSFAEVLSSTGRLTEGSWQYIQPMQKPRKLFASANCGDVIYAIGGESDIAEVMKSVEKYDPATKNWTYVSSMNFCRKRHAACVIDGKIIVAGGLNKKEEAILEIECYDPSTDTWCVVGKSECALYDHFLVAI